MSDDLIRVSLMIRKEQHQTMQEMGVNISGYIRDLIDDRLNNHTIALSVGEKTRLLYDQIISEIKKGDKDFEPYVRDALKTMLAEKIESLQDLQKTIKK